MWFFKRKKGLPVRAVIADDCFAKLPVKLRSRFYPAPDDADVTHTVQQCDNDAGHMVDDFVLSAVVEGGLDLLLGSSNEPTENYVIDTNEAYSVDTSATDEQNDSVDSNGGSAGASDTF
jgi:hypothetical protein